ncbi:aminotransferase [Streptomyces cinnamoneus]|uniref:Aminotransferase n=1 Tax=Streptomyces cinnamoneus TaxID=53446 RepID=A0A2G1XLV8_STRCJ|nr:aminotransferase class I/II-fold pyridoxal phosphate-dependent enzyme [Streptomyces cinnamoneus]PHQ52161.1 aminotransferase [Streptomyces cinnamoneus]PPT16242.1 aminotransferase [Streptomyces cinnamoneus]
MKGHAVAAPAALTLADYADLARRGMDAAVWDFLAGGAGEERTLAANLAAFGRVRLLPRVLTGAGRPVTMTRILGRDWAAPVGIAPLAYHTMADPEGETATARAAGRAGLPLIVSTFAGRTLEDVAAAAAGAPLWLQVYCFRDRDVTRRLVERAERAGFEALVLTADAPHLGRRLRDLRNGFRLPAGIGPANLEGAGFASPRDHSLMEFDPGLDWSAVAWLRSVSSLPVLVKGVLTAADACRAVEAGAAGVVVSNHGGRQLDGAVATLDALPEITAALAGACPVLLDGGVRRGVDVLAALALGADAVLLGRPVLDGLAVDGASGVARVLDILVGELTDAMSLSGLGSVADATPGLVRLATGTAAPEPPPPAPARSADDPEAPRTGDLRGEDLHGSLRDPVLDTMNFLNEITHRYPEAVSFAPGRPYDRFFDVEQVFTSLRRYCDHLAEQGQTPEQIRDALFQYGPTSGRIRGLIADWLRADEGIDVPAESIVVTVGCQEAMVLALRALVQGPRDALLVASPCYVGITGAARLLDIDPTPVAEREDGFHPADLEAVVRAERARGRRPRAFYVVPDHANPSGNTMSLEARHELLELAGRLDLLVLEDSPYRLVSPGIQLPTLKSLDRDRRVVHLGSFSKTLFPGARVGFAVADQTVTDRAGATRLLADELSKLKSMVTVNTSPLSQAAVAGMLLAAGGRASQLNAGTAAHYGEAMRATLRRLDACFAEPRRAGLKVRWNKPDGGFFLVVKVPFVADNAALARSAQDFGVIWTPMAYFYPQGGGEHEIRLSVSYLSLAEIDEGVGRLAAFIEHESETASGASADAVEEG